MKNQKLYASLFAIAVTIGMGQFATKNDAPSETYIPRMTETKVEPVHFQPTQKTTEEIRNYVSDGNNIKVALLLDTSSSMSGLIEQAKSQLWQILNQLATTRRTDGQDSRLEIALYEYGNPSKSDSRSKQIRKLSAFTTDMDLISKELFSLTTNGGQENCGETIWTSLTELKWGRNNNDLKMIYIAGNEPFTQGPVNFSLACQKAVENDVVINTIFCGDWHEGIRSSWQEGAELGKGEYMNINHNKTTTYIETPYDQKIGDLNTRLNKTYIPYGKKGEEKLRNQQEQDSNARIYSSANVADRAVFKSSKKYTASDWDLVDAYKNDKKVLNNTKAMPDTLQNLTTNELEAKIQNILAERDQINLEIQQNNVLRQNFIIENSSSSQEENNLKNSIKKSIEKHAKLKGYQVD